jgi:predicted P-loop ATPase
VFAWNEFSSNLMVLRHMPGRRNPALQIPRALTEADISNATDWLQRNRIRVASSVTLEAIRAVADEHRCHPVREYLNGLAWDQTPRIDTWLTDHLGAADTALNRAFGSKWMIGAVARVMRPGCKLDTVLILESLRQGLMKSTVFATLGDPWFTDHMPDLGTKDAMQQLQGVWIIEHAELSSMSRSGMQRTKAFLSTRVDRFRPSYGRVTADHPRQCAFGGTVNIGGSGYLRDETGARRFWPVECAVGWKPDRRVDIAALAKVKDQLWAEALHRFEAREPWWLDADMEIAQEEAAEQRFEDDSREAIVRAFLRDRSYVRMFELLGATCLDVPPDRQTRALQIDIGRILRTLKWIRRQRRLSRDQNVREWLYLKPDFDLSAVKDAEWGHGDRTRRTRSRTSPPPNPAR